MDLWKLTLFVNQQPYRGYVQQVSTAFCSLVLRQVHVSVSGSDKGPDADGKRNTPFVMTAVRGRLGGRQTSVHLSEVLLLSVLCTTDDPVETGPPELTLDYY